MFLSFSERKKGEGGGISRGGNVTLHVVTEILIDDNDKRYGYSTPANQNDVCLNYSFIPGTNIMVPLSSGFTGQ